VILVTDLITGFWDYKHSALLVESARRGSIRLRYTQLLAERCVQ